MISDSPPDRELEWTDEGIQSSKNLVNRIERYFQNQFTKVNEDTEKKLERYVHDIEKNILNFSLNKCVADIYTLFNYLEKSNIYLSNNKLSIKILICLYPILPSMSARIFKKLFDSELQLKKWPNVNTEMLIENNINLPIQIKGKMVTTISTVKGYELDKLLKLVYDLEKIKSKIENKKVLKVINVQDKIINIITS